MVVERHTLIKLNPISRILRVRIGDLRVGEWIVTIAALAEHVGLHLKMVHGVLTVSLLLVAYH